MSITTEYTKLHTVSDGTSRDTSLSQLYVVQGLVTPSEVGAATFAVTDALTGTSPLTIPYNASVVFASLNAGSSSAMAGAGAFDLGFANTAGGAITQTLLPNIGAATLADLRLGFSDAMGWSDPAVTFPNGDYYLSFTQAGAATDASSVKVLVVFLLT